MNALRKTQDICSKAFPLLLGLYVCIFVFYRDVAVQITAFTAFEDSTFLGNLFYHLIFHGSLVVVAVGLASGKLTRQTPGLRWYIVFTIIVIISALVNYDNVPVTNILNAVYMFCFICIFAHYAYWVHTTEDGKEHLKQLLLLAFGIFTVLCLISLLQLIMLHSYAVVLVTNEVKRQGFADGRLFGIFNHPNSDAAISLLAIAFGTFHLLRNKPRHKKLIIACMVINYLYFAATGSRSARVCLAVMFVVCWFLIGRKSGLLKDDVPRWFTRRNFFIIGILSVGLCFAIDFAIACYVSAAKPLLDELGISHNAYSILAWRPDTQLSNISNNRFDIWISYIEILSDGSFLFGWGFMNLVSEIAEVYPFSYVSQAFYMPHNSLLMICAASGIFAMLVWIWLIIKIVIRFAWASLGIVGERLRLEDMLAFCVFAIILTESSFANTIWYWANWDLPFFIVSMAYLFIRFPRKQR